MRLYAGLDTDLRKTARCRGRQRVPSGPRGRLPAYLAPPLAGGGIHERTAGRPGGGEGPATLADNSGRAVGRPGWTKPCPTASPHAPSASILAAISAHRLP